MKIRVGVMAACAVLIFGYSSACAAEGNESCREKNIRFLMKRLELSEQAASGNSKILMETLKHQLQLKSKLRERQSSAAILPAASDGLQPFEPCSECAGEDQNAQE